MQTSEATDAELAQRAAGGDGHAFGELYRRHAPAAWRLAHAVTGNAEDAADAVADAFTRVLQALPAGRLQDAGSFRSYLLTTTRHAAIDTARKAGRQRPADVSHVSERPSLGVSASERVVDAADRALVAAAFRGLPERWRSVLWLTEVEQLPAREAAPLLGLSPNGVSQLAVRARNGLRERYLQAQVRRTEVQPECRDTVARLGAYVAGALSPRDLAKADQHLAACAECRERQAELEDVGGRLRHAAVPLPLTVAALAKHRWKLGRARKAAAWLAQAERPLAMATAALFTLGVASLGTVDRHRVGRPDLVAAPAPRPAPAAAPARTGASFAGDTPSVPFVVTASVTAEPAASPAFAGSPGTTVAVAPIDGPVLVPIDDGSVDITVTPPSTTSTTTPADPQPRPRPAAQIHASISTAALTGSLAAGQGTGSCTGGSVGGQSAGCAPAPPSGGHTVEISTGGTQVPEQQVGLPPS
ncbi:MAG TPA: sigma-70 family RNA polymerase sigma factor [Acidimicrobiales bacterium]|nr:sigma-70 family RNA polymerase sigma factor [Acidimicrobiales bacterium]